jgi:hypothetical protein
VRLSVAVGLLSGAALACEILLMRLLSIVQWHHFAFLVISLALLGYGASGAVLTVAREAFVQRFEIAFPSLAAGFGLTSVGSFVVAQRLRLNPLEVMWDPGQLLAFAAVYLVLAVPFLCAGAAIGLALVRSEGTVHTTYRADLVGAAAGAVVAIAALDVFSPEDCLRLVSAVGWLAAALGLMAGAGGRSEWATASPDAGERVVEGSSPNRRRVLAAAALATGIVLAVAWPDSWVVPRMSEYKALSKALTAPGVEVLAERSSARGALAALRSPRVPFRLASGLSLAFAGEVPEQVLVFRDGETVAIIEGESWRSAELDYLDYLPGALPFRLLETPRTALVGTGGGSWVSLALRQGASEVHVIENDPELLRLVGRDLASFGGGLYDEERVRWHAGAPRSFLVSSAERFDLIWLQLPAAAAPGAHALRESFSETVEALELMTGRLRGDGILAIGGEIDAPPRTSLKIVATVAVALEETGLEPRSRVAMIRSWSSFVLLVRPDGWTKVDLERVRAFSDERFFDLVYYPGMNESEANRFNVLPRPAHFRGVEALLGPGRERFVEEYGFDIRPAVDDRPFFFDFFRWRSFRELMANRVRGSAALVEWGYVLLVAALAQAGLAGLVFIVLPVASLRRPLLRGGGGRIGTYFLCLGLAFLLIEVGFLQRTTLVLGDPLCAAATVLGGFLFFAGLGSGVSRRLEQRWGSTVLPVVIVSVAGLTTLSLMILPALVRASLGLPVSMRALLVVLLIAPLAFLMGMPFPLGLRRVAATVPEFAPWAWGVNGWASVLAAVLAVLLAVHFGFRAVLAAGCGLYLIAGLTMPRKSGEESRSRRRGGTISSRPVV